MGSYQPKATFNVAKVNNQRFFTPVNKRARIVVRKAGKRKGLTASQLKAQVGKGSYKFFAYAVAGDWETLKPIRF